MESGSQFRIIRCHKMPQFGCLSLTCLLTFVFSRFSGYPFDSATGAGKARHSDLEVQGLAASNSKLKQNLKLHAFGFQEVKSLSFLNVIDTWLIHLNIKDVLFPLPERTWELQVPTEKPKRLGVWVTFWTSFPATGWESSSSCRNRDLSA